MASSHYAVASAALVVPFQGLQAAFATVFEATCWTCCRGLGSNSCRGGSAGWREPDLNLRMKEAAAVVVACLFAEHAFAIAAVVGMDSGLRRRVGPSEIAELAHSVAALGRSSLAVRL